MAMLNNQMVFPFIPVFPLSFPSLPFPSLPFLPSIPVFSISTFLPALPALLPSCAISLRHAEQTPRALKETRYE